MLYRLSVSAVFVLLMFSCQSVRYTETSRQEAAQALSFVMSELLSPEKETALKLNYRVLREGQDADKGSLTYCRWDGQREYMRFRYSLFRFKVLRSGEKVQLHVPQTDSQFLDESDIGDDKISFAALLADILKLDANPWKKADLSSKLFWQGYFSDVEQADDGAYIKRVGDRISHAFYIREGRLDKLFMNDGKARIELFINPIKMPSYSEVHDGFDEYRIVVVPDGELHKTLRRGISRLAEIRLMEFAGSKPQENSIIKGPHGSFEIREGQKVVHLKGDPYEIGFQHGRFLSDDAQRTVDSTLYIVGLVYSMKKSSWFLDDIRKARKRLDQHLPDEYMQELMGIADGAGISRKDILLANYFPALFHCSGFTVSGEATSDGRLYHGRILDYMSNVGLQYSAVVFAVEKKGCLAFTNVGYAGFAGSVTGMNEAKISIGEMGGAGEGLWDGISMPFLIRMGLEKARNLEELKAIFRDNKRTCEYYYVFADGKNRASVGVYATPEKIEFVEPGAWHELLQNPQNACLLFSAGSRYENLSELTESYHGQFNDSSIFKLFDYPVASEHNNLHSVLFSPEDLSFWVSNAGRNGKAYDQKFYFYKFKDLIKKDSLKKFK